MTAMIRRALFFEMAENFTRHGHSWVTSASEDRRAWLEECRRQRGKMKTGRSLARSSFGVAGVDEAGRGPLAGPVVAAAVILPPGFLVPGLDDSKCLSEKLRRLAFRYIIQNAVSVAVGYRTADEIDRLGIRRATLQAMRMAVRRLLVKPKLVMVDGVDTVEGLTVRQRAMVEGDARTACIAAASIVAKVTRDTHMIQQHRLYPHYDFANNKGYGTEVHRCALRKLGPSPIHRHTFSGVGFEQRSLFS